MDQRQAGQLWRILVSGIALASTVTIASPAVALDVPPLTGRVLDLAHILSTDDVDRLTSQLKAHEEQTGNQVAVLTLPSLEGETLEPYSHRVATTWKLGQKGADNGVLLLVALKERKVRIEVGYGLEGTLTDLRSAHIIREEIVPRFRAGEMSSGIAAGVAAIIMTIEGTYRATESPLRGITSGSEPTALHYVVIGIVAGFLAGVVLSQGLRSMRALLGSVLAFIVAQLAGIPLGLVAAGITALLLWLLLRADRGRRRGMGLDDWTWYSSRGGGWSTGSFDGGGFSGGGGDFGGGGASGDW